MLDKLVSDILRNICNQLNFITQCNLRSVSKPFLPYVITNLSDDVPNVHEITNEICQLYPHAIKLNIGNNPKVTDISHLLHLQTLYCYRQCGIDNDEILSLTNLTALKNRGNCGVDQKGIALLSESVEIYAEGNKKIEK